MFKRGDFVWGKIKSYPSWPAVVLNAEDCGKTNSSNNKLWLFWFGDHKFSEVDIQHITDFKANYSENSQKSNGKLFRKAVEEALHALASEQEVQFQGVSLSILKWAASGFPSTPSQPFTWKKKLPQVVATSLSAALKTNDEENDDSDMDTDDALRDVCKGRKTLEDICISCCKKNEKLIAPHPLFIGSVCMQCKKSVFKACKVPSGQIQDVCVICGLGGNLVYCSNNLCSRSFCQVCIEYMVSDKAYEEIKENDKWLCYLCEVDMNKNCLIKRRTIHQASLSSLPPAPNLKTSINVLALSENGLNVLQKARIKVGKYRINPDCETSATSHFMDYSKNYKDFSYDEIAEISADLILGSFFTPDLSYDRKTCVTKFFIVFYRFLYRLDATRLLKENVFFIFSAEISMLDENIFCRVLRFLRVKPVPFTFKERKFLVWSNLSNSVYIRPKIPEETLPDNEIEEKIMFPFVKYLQKYFEKN